MNTMLIVFSITSKLTSGTERHSCWQCAGEKKQVAMMAMLVQKSFIIFVIDCITFHKSTLYNTQMCTQFFWQQELQTSQPLIHIYTLCALPFTSTANTDYRNTSFYTCRLDLTPWRPVPDVIWHRMFGVCQQLHWPSAYKVKVHSESLNVFQFQPQLFHGVSKMYY